MGPKVNSIRLQVFFTMEQVASARVPNWMFSDRVEPEEGHGWRHVPTELMHPLELPPAIRSRYGCVLLQTGPAGSMVAASVRLGQPLNLDQLKLLQGHYRFPLPGPKQGSGKHGGIVKLDYAKALVAHFFKDASQEEIDGMVNGIMGKQIKHLSSSVSNRHSEDIVQAFNQGLEKDDQRDYLELAQVAADEELLRKARAERSDRKTDLKKADQKHFSPHTLRDLCPGPARLNRHPALKRYQAFYSGIDPETGNLVSVISAKIFLIIYSISMVL